MAVRGSFGGHFFCLDLIKCVILLRCCLPLKKKAHVILLLLLFILLVFDPYPSEVVKK